MSLAVNSIRTQTTIDPDWNVIIGHPVLECMPLGRGRNSRTYKIQCMDGRLFAAKQYFRHPDDPRDRIATELTALTVFTKHDIDCCPKIFCVACPENIAVFEYIQGEKITDIRPDDIDQAVSFAKTLKELSRMADREIPSASEAFFSSVDILSNIRTRLQRLYDTGEQPYAEEMKRFLQSDFEPALEHHKVQCQEILKQHLIPFEKKISRSEKTLSPSDFGFHNALKIPGGGIFFLDFEYFGWDDPAKMICDFVLHPAMNLTDNHKRRFVNGMLGAIDASGLTAIRTQAYYPLFGLKWCLIILNEFQPLEFARRSFAKGEKEELSVTLFSQLNKAKQMLERTVETYDRFCTYLA